MRREFLNSRLLALCGPNGRLVPPRNMGAAAQADELAALGRTVSSIAPSVDYASWWTRFEDALLGGLSSRAWPTIADMRRTARDLQGSARASAARLAGGAEEPPHVYSLVEEWWLRFGAPGPGAMPRAHHARPLVEAGHASWGKLWRAGFPIPDWARREAMSERDTEHENRLAEIRAIGHRLSGAEVTISAQKARTTE